MSLALYSLEPCAHGIDSFELDVRLAQHVEECLKVASFAYRLIIMHFDFGAHPILSEQSVLHSVPIRESRSFAFLSLSIRSDNGPEYISGTLKNWAEQHAIRLDYIQPGNPQQNAYIERYNCTVRYDWLSHYLFESIGEVQDYATKWMWTYNHERPHMALGGITPKQKLAFLTRSTFDPN